ncbi:MAG: lipid II flippase MurJ [Candidatus Dojkabacteria bacterium]|nr:lipid II flippase MurJ [Candidatus Dojkabacteria bacterium]
MPLVKKRIKKITDLLGSEQKHILETAFILMLPVILTKITGQLFTLLLASYYGATDSRLNQFFIANTIPELLTTVLMTGALGTVVIPVLIASKSKYGKEQFYRVYSSILNATIIIFLIVSALLIVFAGKFVPAAINLVNRMSRLHKQN